MISESREFIGEEVGGFLSQEFVGAGFSFLTAWWTKLSLTGGAGTEALLPLPRGQESV